MSFCIGCTTGTAGYRILLANYKALYPVSEQCDIMAETGSTDDGDGGDTDAGGTYVCDVCGLPFDSEEELQEHATVAHGQ